MKFVDIHDAKIGEFVRVMDLQEMQYFSDIYRSSEKAEDVEFRAMSNPNKIIRFRPHLLITGEFILERTL